MTARRWVIALVATLAIGLLVWRVVKPPVVGSDGRATPASGDGRTVAATVTSLPVVSNTECADEFEAVDLDHVTKASDVPVRQFDSNGSGVAADDLDGNGFIDIVLGNLEGPNTILWNEGDWRFTTELMTDRATRAVQLVDVDADGRLDIVTTHRGSGVAWFRNLGERRFERSPLVGVGAAAYSMSWADADLDGDLDLATGSYDAELDQVLRSGFLFSDGAGVYAYTQDEGRFTGDRLAETSQALATSYLDLDLDGAPELVVGNDFSIEDDAWRRVEGGWIRYQPFRNTAAHPMSLEAGDVDNDGVEEIFASDMKPTSTDVDVLALWMPFVASMEGLDNPDGVQRIRNVLQVNQGDGTYHDDGNSAGLDTAGWAWSSRFGDLDNDGDSDLYVVNGMIAAESFPQLERAELVERNVMFVNRGRGRFETAGWGLDSERSGRGSVLADLDNDGRLDIVVNNLEAPAQAFRNRRCDGNSVTVELRWPDSGNTHAIGARITGTSESGEQVRFVRSGGGYLSGASVRLHLGVGADGALRGTTVRWPDGAVTDLGDLVAGSYSLVERNDG